MRYTLKKFADEYPSDYQVYDIQLHGIVRKAHSFRGKSNKKGIRFKDDTIIWNGLEIQVVIDYDNYYENQALQCDICYCRMVRKYIRNSLVLHAFEYIWK